MRSKTLKIDFESDERNDQTMTKNGQNRLNNKIKMNRTSAKKKTKRDKVKKPTNQK